MAGRMDCKTVPMGFSSDAAEFARLTARYRVVDILLTFSISFLPMAQYTLEKIVQVFEMLPTWDDKYAFLTEVGEKMDRMPAEWQRDEHQVHGCMSKVWVVGDKREDGGVHLRADCDTPVVKGLVALLVLIFQDKTPEEIRATDVDVLFHELGLDENISPNRHVGMYAMVDKIKKIATELG